MKTHPLDGVRVLNLGRGNAGRGAAMLLAGPGAEVIEIDRPGRPEATHDAALGLGLSNPDRGGRRCSLHHAKA